MKNKNKLVFNTKEKELDIYLYSFSLYNIWE